jgi:prepilin-type N-terminal cleavage/methylation domain-containing protein
MTNEGSTDGFTLLETLIAFLVLSIFLAMAVQTVGQSALNISRSRQQAEILECARTVLAQTRVAMRYSLSREGVWRGRCHWKLTVGPVPIETAGSVESVVLTLTLDGNPRSKTTYVGFADGAN